MLQLEKSISGHQFLTPFSNQEHEMMAMEADNNNNNNNHMEQNTIGDE